MTVTGGGRTCLPSPSPRHGGLSNCGFPQPPYLVTWAPKETLSKQGLVSGVLWVPGPCRVWEAVWVGLTAPKHTLRAGGGVEGGGEETGYSATDFVFGEGLVHHLLLSIPQCTPISSPAPCLSLLECLGVWE